MLIFESVLVNSLMTWRVSILKIKSSIYDDFVQHPDGLALEQRRCYPA